MKYLVLINPASNGGRALKKWREYSSLLADCDAVILQNIEQARELAETALGYDVVVACGGDGTVNAVADGVMCNPDTELQFGVLYAGTSPDFCSFYHIPLETRAAVACLKSGKVRKVEVLQANGRHFFCPCNLGVGADVATLANRIRPWLGDKFGTFCALLWNILKSKKVNYLVNGERIDNCNHLLITQIPQIAGGLKLKLPELNESEYALWYLQNISLFGWLALLPKFYRGENCGNIEICFGITKITADEKVKIEYDGDPHGELPLEIVVSNRKLNLIVGE